MPLFGPRQLPMTSYGYQPPREAVARNWYCISEGCGTVGDAAPRRWPHPCSRCGGPTDPVLVEPWEHEARGVEIRHLLANGVEDGGFTEYNLPLWEFKEALRTGDRAAAQKARMAFRTIDARNRDESRGWIPGNGYFMLVWDALGAGDLDSAADDLLHWFAISDAEDVEGDNSRRTNCRQVIDSALRFFAAPGGAGHSQAESIREQCLGLAAGAYPVLNAEQQAGVRRLQSA